MEKAKLSHLDISKTIGVPFDFSSDLSSGRRPTRPNPRRNKSKGTSRTSRPPIVIEIVWCEQLFTAEIVLYLFGASLRTGTPRAWERGVNPFPVTEVSTFAKRIFSRCRALVLSGRDVARVRHDAMGIASWRTGSSLSLRHRNGLSGRERRLIKPPRPV